MPATQDMLVDAIHPWMQAPLHFDMTKTHTQHRLVCQADCTWSCQKSQWQEAASRRCAVSCAAGLFTMQENYILVNWQHCMPTTLDVHVNPKRARQPRRACQP